MLAHPQHIKCLEAVMLALHLTNGPAFASLDRIPIGFKTVETATGHEYRRAIRPTLVADHGPVGVRAGMQLSRTPSALHS
jgi:hypothetical protein